MTRETDQLSARLRRADDAALTEMARSLMRDARPPAGVAGGGSVAAQAERARRAGGRFRRAPAGRLSSRPLAAPPA
jgi:hypothetical protein